MPLCWSGAGNSEWFTSDEVSLMEYSVDPETLCRIRRTVNIRVEQKENKKAVRKANRQASWKGAAEVMFIDDTIDSLFGKK